MRLPSDFNRGGVTLTQFLRVPKKCLEIESIVRTRRAEQTRKDRARVRALNRRIINSNDDNPLIHGRLGPCGSCMVEGREGAEC